MSWASRRKSIYTSGIVIFFLIILGGPLVYKVITIQPTCHDGIKNHGESAVDEGGPCLMLDPRTVEPISILWARSFKVRSGVYNAVAYVENPNKSAGLLRAGYKFDLYDASNVRVAEVTGSTYIMPGGITPIFVSGIDTGNSVAAHTYFTLTDDTPAWEWLDPSIQSITISNKSMQTISTAPRLSATIANTSALDLYDASFVAVPFDTAGNAITVSATHVQVIRAGNSAQIIFTWPDAFQNEVGSIDIIPTKEPVPDAAAER